MVEADFDIKTKVIGILESMNMADKRAAKCDLDDFLSLLLAFNNANIHFS